MKRICAALIVCVVVSAVSASLAVNVVAAEREDALGAALELLVRAQRSTLNMSMYYEETILSALSGEVQLSTRRVWQASADRYRIETVDAEGDVIVTIADGSRVWVIDPRTQSILRQPVTSPSWQPPAATSGRVMEGTFADRPVHIVMLRTNRQTHTYTIDAETGVLLKEEITAADGTLLYMAYRTNLEVGAAFDPELFTYRPPEEALVTTDRSAWRAQRLVRQLADQSGFSVHFPRNLPPGYEFMDGSVHILEDDVVVALHFRSGTSVLSVFQQEEPITTAMVRQLLRRLRSESRQQLSAVTKATEGRSYLAVGPLSERELERVLASMEELGE